VTETDRPDGTKIIETKTAEVNQDVTKATASESDTKSSDSVEDITYGDNKLNLSVMAGYDYHAPTINPVWGVGITKQVLGPITLGTFLFTDLKFGVTAGVNF
jgi:hypothetical protein